MSYLTTTRFPAAYQDALGRLRVAQPETVYDAAFYTSKGDTEWAELLSGDGAVEHTPGDPNVGLRIASDGRVVRATRRYIPYAPGKGYLTLLSGTLQAGESDATARIGAFDDADDVDAKLSPVSSASAGNGFFFELRGGRLNVVARTRVDEKTGELLPAPVDTAVPQGEWNVDRLDGAGPSGYTLDPRARQIFLIAASWLGGGGVSLGVVANGALAYCHTFRLAGAGVGAYSARGSLPLRFELRGGKSLMYQTAAAVLSEGGFEAAAPRARYVAEHMGRDARKANADPSPMLAVRLKADRVRATLAPATVGLAGPVDAPVLVTLYRFIAPEAYGSLDALFGGSAGAWTAANALPAAPAGFTDDVSVAEVNTTMGDTLDLSGTYPYIRVAAGYVTTAGSVAVDGERSRVDAAASTPQGYSDVYVVAAAVAGGGSAGVYASLRWLEYE